LNYCLSQVDFGAVKFLTHFDAPSNPHIVKIPQIKTIREYSDFMINGLTDYFTTSHVLVIQWDGYITNAAAWNDEFLNYDYLGAPWHPSLVPMTIPRNHTVGNGGFSLRSKKLCDVLKNNENIVDHYAEDVLICQVNRPYLETQGIKFPSAEVASKFAWETIPPTGATFGVHGASHGMLLARKSI
jgi:hypothetical protein